MFTIMHISDIHRSKADLISNEELLSCLLTDRERYLRGDPPISKLDAIMVSGDLVLGLPLGAKDYPDALEKQYDEALDLLIRLADNFVNGDRSKVIIIPGNHDVDWNLSLSSMRVVSHSGNDIPKLLSTPSSSYRWSWESMSLLQIVDQEIYEDRFKYFCNLYTRFYDGVHLAFPLDTKRYWNLFELDDGKIIVSAFNSCSNNDCFNFSGEIPSRAISDSHLELTAKRKDTMLKIAFWHHDVQGPPMRSDYMDLNTIRLMIDRGYRLGLHGHQHKSEAAPHSIYASEKQTIAVVSAGSLCAGPDELPQGFSRQYNIVEIHDDYRHARIHVREMNIPGIFAMGRVAMLGNHSYVDVEWSPTLPSPFVNTGRGGGHIIMIVEEIEKQIKAGRYEDAIKLIDSSADKLGLYGRQLLTRALFDSGKWDRLLVHLSHPQNIDELTTLLRAAVELKKWPEGEEILKMAQKSQQYPERVICDLEMWFNTERRIK